MILVILVLNYAKVNLSKVIKITIIGKYERCKTQKCQKMRFQRSITTLAYANRFQH